MSSNQTSSPPKVALDKKTRGKETSEEDTRASELELTAPSGMEIDSARDENLLTDAAEPDPPVVCAEPEDAKGALSWARRRWAALLVALLLLASAGGTGAVYWWVYRPDLLTNAAAQQQVLDAAKQGTTSLLSYAPETLDKDLATAKSHLTGEFLKYYSDFTDQIVAPAARQKGVKTEAAIVRAAVSEMHPDRAVVLVFVNQVTTSKDRPEPALATSSVIVTMDKSQGRWLISEFKPV
jgi:Mce-associated membrane protein